LWAITPIRNFFKENGQGIEKKYLQARNILTFFMAIIVAVTCIYITRKATT
jgi:succinate dehydrogenase/fumarate reductase cytochrome b subunit